MLGVLGTIQNSLLQKNFLIQVHLILFSGLIRLLKMKIEEIEQIEQIEE